jgi:hypothetical protein
MKTLTPDDLLYCAIRQIYGMFTPGTFPDNQLLPAAVELAKAMAYLQLAEAIRNRTERGL